MTLPATPIPIVQAPMLGAAGVGMVVAVSRAGGLGMLAAGALSGAEIAAAAAEARSATDAPFGINLLMTEPVTPSAAVVETALARLKPWYDQLGAPLPEAPNSFAPDFEEQLAAVIAAAPAVASFAFGCLTADQVAALQTAGTAVVGTATNVAEARVWAAAGADAICAQGCEAGGHRGAFLGEGETNLVGTLALVPLITDAVGLPVIAAGGIMDGRGVAAALALGAVAAQMGTAFLLSHQATLSPAWRDAVASAGDDATRITRAFTGRQARGIENRFMREMRGVEGEVPAYPVQNRLTQPLRAAAAKADDAEMISLWAGQGVTMAEPGDAGDMVRAWWAQARDAARAMS